MGAARQAADRREDLRVAVTELSSALIDDHDTDARLELRFRVDGDAVVVDGRRPAPSTELPELDPIARVLAVTTDEHRIEERGGGDWTFTVRKGPSAL